MEHIQSVTSEGCVQALRIEEGYAKSIRRFEWL